MSGTRENNQRKSSRYISPEHSVRTDTYKPSRKITNYSAMPDLPREARDCLVTVEKLATMGRGTLADSIWALPEDKAEQQKFNNKHVANKQEPVLPTAKIGTPVVSKAPGGTPAILNGGLGSKGNGLAASRWAAPSSQNNKAGRKTGDGPVLKPDPKGNGLAASRWAAPSPKTYSSTSQCASEPHAMETQKSPPAAGLETDNYMLPHLRGIEPKSEMQPEAKDSEPILPPAVVDAKNVVNQAETPFETPNVKVETDSYILPHLRGIEIEQEAKPESKTCQSNDVDAKNMSSIPPHLRHTVVEGQQKSKPSIITSTECINNDAETNESYLLPHLRAIKKAKQRNSLSDVSGDEHNASAKIERNLSATPGAGEGHNVTAVPSIRSDIPEVDSMKSIPEMDAKATSHQVTRLASASEFMREVNARKSQRDALAKDNRQTNMQDTVSSNVQGQNSKLTDKKCNLNSPRQGANIVGGIKAHQQAPKQDILTQGAQVHTAGSAPRSGGKDFEDCVDGVQGIENPKEIVRAKQGRPAAEAMVDWDGSWMPPVSDWEYDRSKYDNSGFVSEYIEEWRAHAPSGPDVTVDTKSEDFGKAALPIQGDSFATALFHSPTIPDTENSENEEKRQRQTALTASYRFASGRKRGQGPSQLRFAATGYNQATRKPQLNPFAPTIDAHFRPATVGDAAGVAALYNYYVNDSHITEDQSMLAETDAAHMINLAQKDRLPFIVAILGKKSVVVEMQGASGSAQKTTLSCPDVVIGFANAESFNYGFTGERAGRSRATVNLQLYVHPDHTRHGLGRNLLDHLVHIMNPGYAFKNASSWVNPDNDQVYKAGGSGLCHQMIIQLPIYSQNDPNYPWIKNFLYNKYFFIEEARLRCVGRSSKAHGPVKWLDLVFFQAEGSNGQEFHPAN